ncbi:MAG: DUF4286 family protein [Rhodospirillales bacterium]|nr:DUF4286 family protein [Rhodospirillales bacterium]
MAMVLFTVRATIPADMEDNFNRWYNDEHCPHMLRYRGVVSARRYRAILGEDKYQYMAVYEFQDEPTFRRFMESDFLDELRAAYNAEYAVSERKVCAYTLVWP